MHPVRQPGWQFSDTSIGARRTLSAPQSAASAERAAAACLIVQQTKRIGRPAIAACKAG